MKAALAVLLSLCMILSVTLLVVVTSQNAAPALPAVASQSATPEPPAAATATATATASQTPVPEPTFLDTLLTIPLGTSIDDCEKMVLEIEGLTTRREVPDPSVSDDVIYLYIDENSAAPKILGHQTVSLSMDFYGDTAKNYALLYASYPLQEVTGEIGEQDLQMLQDLWAILAGKFGGATSLSSFKSYKDDVSEEYAVPSKEGLLDMETLLAALSRDPDKDFHLQANFGPGALRFDLYRGDDGQSMICLSFFFHPMYAPV